MRALVLDFDGVVSNSAPEAYLVARRTYAEVGPAHATEARLTPPTDGFRLPLAAIQADPLYERFLSLIPLGNRAEDYGVMLSILERGAEVHDQEDYDRERARVSTGFVEAFHTRFYQLRDAFRSDHPKSWRALQSPYPDLVRVLERRAGDTSLAIATAKDRGAVRALLDHYRIGHLFPDERLADKETGQTKTAHLCHLQATLEVAFDELTFLDDKVNHLDAVAPLGVRCALANWGYNGTREHALARDRGYLVCSLGDVEEQLFDK
jgi:phosphoglycolate phosphatase-like HAD superfamily hydrolase